MMRKAIKSCSLKNKHPSAISYLAATGVVLFGSILTTSSAQARNRIAPVQVIVYEGQPIDYSHRSDVILIEDFSDSTNYTNVEIAQVKPVKKPTKPVAIAKQKPAVQAVKKPHIAQQQRPKLVAKVKRPPQVKPAPVTVQKTLKNTAVIAQKKPQLPAISLPANAKGKDQQLIAFYREVFESQKNVSPIQSEKSTIKLVVKPVTVKKLAQKKSKPQRQAKRIQLAKTSIKGKDPQLVAFYHQVFGKEQINKIKAMPAIATLSKKDPELVAFYQQVFSNGKNSQKSDLVLAIKVDKKLKIAAKSKSKSKLKKKQIAKKIKNNPTKPMSTAAVELQRLIDELSNKNII